MIHYTYLYKYKLFYFNIYNKFYTRYHTVFFHVDLFFFYLFYVFQNYLCLVGGLIYFIYIYKKNAINIFILFQVNFEKCKTGNFLCNEYI